MRPNEALVSGESGLRAVKPRPLFILMVCVWTVIVASPALFCQWFTLDMGGVFIWATEFPGNLTWVLSPYDKGGRYFPVYWLYHFSLFRIFTTHVAGYYAVQSALFALSLTMTCYLFWRITGNRAATFALGIVAALGGAVAENLYTVGKGEPLAYLFLVSALVILHRAAPSSVPASAGRMAALVFLVALAVWSKETSLVILAFAPAAIAVALFVHPGSVRACLGEPRLVRVAGFFLCVLGGIALSKAPYLLFEKRGDSSTYVDYTIDADLLLENLSFYAAQQPDVLVFGLASLALLGMLAIRARSAPDLLSSRSRADLAFVWGLLAIGWGYYAGLLIWRWPMGYYMLLPSIAFKFTAIYGFVTAWESRVLPQRVFAVSWGLFIAGVAYSILHAFYVATSQATYSRMYTEAVSRYLEVAPPSSRLVFESFPFYAEQVTNTQQVIQLLTGDRRTLAGIADVVDPAVVRPEIVRLLRLRKEQLDRNEASLPRAGDYLLVMTGNKLATWFVRGVSPYYSDDSILLKQGAYDMIPVAENRVFVPGVLLNVWTYRPSIGNTYVGYKLYRVTNDIPRLLWRGRYPDQWMGKSASLRLSAAFGKRATVRMSTPAFNSPNRVSISQDGRPLREVLLVAGEEASFEVENARGGAEQTVIQFTVERTVVPKDIKLNKDEREIGVLVRVEPHV